MNEITRQEIEALVQVWRDRARTVGYDPKTKQYAHLEVEFFMGALALLDIHDRSYPPIWNLIIMSGRSLADTLCPEARPEEGA